MAQVIIVSNRLPLSVIKKNGRLSFTPSLGGLATGLSSFVNDPGNIWIGWPGIVSDELNANDMRTIATELRKQNCYPVFLSRKQIDNFYNGYSNSVLWPLFHDLPTGQISSAQLNTWWRAYREVNLEFAKVVMELASPKSRIWVHDYHLMLLPELLRKKHAKINIGFFLHIPFPDIKTLRPLADGKKLLKGLLGADLIGFHTVGYVQNFLTYSKAMKIGLAKKNHIELSSHTVRVAEFPMGIDYEKYAKAGKSKHVRQAVKRYNKRYRGLKVIVSVDRLDPTKGLIERLSAFNEYLKRNPNQHGKVVFAMVAAPSRTDIIVYKELADRLKELANSINNNFGSSKWKPVDYMSAQPFEEVAALFQIADIAFIVPLRDGMNLTAKEFVASNKKQGVLILSGTAGAAEELHEALIVDPNKPESLVKALEQAMSMRKRELRGSLNRMKKNLSINTVQNWAITFIDTLQQPIPYTPRVTWTLSRYHLQDLYSDFRSSSKRLIVLDYDGTLVPFSSNYRNAKPPKSLLKLLHSLCAEPDNDVLLISGRSHDDLQDWFSELRINLVAEHGAAIKIAGHKKWHTVKKSSTDWKKRVLLILKDYTLLTPGARIESKTTSLAWHYREATPYYAQKHAVVIKKELKPLLRNYGLELMQGNKVLEIKDPRITKGKAVQSWLDKNYQFILAMGDDVTDETLFSALTDDSYSIKIGRGRTTARFRVKDSGAAIALLKKLSKL